MATEKNKDGYPIINETFIKNLLLSFNEIEAASDTQLIKDMMKAASSENNGDWFSSNNNVTMVYAADQSRQALSANLDSNGNATKKLITYLCFYHLSINIALILI